MKVEKDSDKPNKIGSDHMMGSSDSFSSNSSSGNLAQVVSLPKVIDGEQFIERFDYTFLPEYLRTRYDVNNLDFVVTKKRITEDLKCWDGNEFEHYQVNIFGYKNSEDVRIVIENLHLMKIPIEQVQDDYYLSKAQEQMVGTMEERAKFFSSCGFNVDVYWNSRREDPFFKANSNEYSLFELTTIQI